MGRGLAEKKKSKKGGGGPSIADGAEIEAGDGALLQIDPARIRFQYSRIRPVFSGCGRTVESTLDDIRKGRLRPSDLPPIQVLIGPEVDVNAEQEPGQWYFSLNNRRLWVLKRCREEGLLGPSNKIGVRVRRPKSQKEAERYTLKNCAVEAKFVQEKLAGVGKKKADTRGTDATGRDDGRDDASSQGDDGELLSKKMAEINIATQGSSQGVQDNKHDDRGGKSVSMEQNDCDEEDESSEDERPKRPINRFAFGGIDSDSD